MAQALSSIPDASQTTGWHRLRPLASCAFVIGALSLCAAPAIAGCNSGSAANARLLTSADCQANASGNQATAVGFDAFARGAYATAVGDGAGPGVVVAGMTVVGTRAGFLGAGIYSTAVGGSLSDTASPHAFGDHSIAIGGGDGVGGNIGARSFAAFGIAVGTGAEARGLRSTAVGAFAGNGSAAGNTRNSAVGAEAGRDVTGSYNAAYGDGAGSDVTGSYNVAIGRKSGSAITANSTVAIGALARATAGQAVAIGYGSLATAANTVSIGTSSSRRRIVNLAPGVAATDAVNVAQLNAATSAAVASAAPAGNAELAALRELVELLAARLDQQQARLDQQQVRIAQLENRKVAEASATSE
jgi:trimeric autotransporter adhesin